MSQRISLAVLLAAGFFFSFGPMYPGDRAYAQGDQALHIDIPVTLEKANVVFDVGHLVLNGDMPFFLGALYFLAGDLSRANVKGEIYGKHGLMKQRIQFELCGATVAANRWINKNLLPGVKMNTDAMVRVTQLEQKGFTHYQ